MRDPGTWLFPLPAVLVSCQDQESPPNIITLAWAGTVCSDPPMLSISVQPRRYSHPIIQQTGEFVVNVPRSTQMEAVDYCGMVSGRDVNKFEACGFTPHPSRYVEVPGILECPVQLECKVEQTLFLGTHDVFISRIVSVSCDEDILQQGRLDPMAAQPLVYAMGHYLSVGEVLGRQGVSRGKYGTGHP